MKRKLPVLAILGALVALVIPASAAAGIYPAGAKFELVGDTAGPEIETSLGSCKIAKITGQVPAAPANETTNPVTGLTVTPGTCSSGTSISVASTGWKFGIVSNPNVVFYGADNEAVILRFASLPGCKLTGNALTGIWSNGYAPQKSAFHAHRTGVFLWANENGFACSLSGKSEAVSFNGEQGGGPLFNYVNNLTSSTSPIVIK